MSQYPDIDYPRRSVEEEKERLLQAFQGRHYEPPNQQKLRYSDKRHYHPPASNQDGEDDGQLDQFGVGNPKNVSSHILPGGLTPTVARLRQMESPDIDYKIQKLHGNMSMGVLSKEEYAAELRNQMREKWERERKEREQRKRGYSPQPTLEYFPFGRGGGGAPLRDENGRIVLAKDVLSGRQSAINNHPTHEQAQLSPPHVERIPRQDRQPHKEEPAIRQRAVPMEEREVVADAVESVTEYVPSARMKKLEEERKYRNELLEQAAVRKRLKAQEEARIREEERRMEEAARNYNPWGREGGGAPLKGRNGKLTGSLREVELKRKKEEMGNEEGDVDEMGGGVKERGRRGRGMGEESEGERSEGEREGVSGLRGMGGSSEIRKRQALEYREELRQQIEQKKREREEERRKAKQDEEAEEKRWKREQNELKKKGLENTTPHMRRGMMRINDEPPQSLSQTAPAKPNIAVHAPVVVDTPREEKKTKQTQQQKEFVMEEGGEQNLNEDGVELDGSYVPSRDDKQRRAKSGRRKDVDGRDRRKRSRHEDSRDRRRKRRRNSSSRDSRSSNPSTSDSESESVTSCASSCSECARRRRTHQHHRKHQHSSHRHSSHQQWLREQEDSARLNRMLALLGLRSVSGRGLGQVGNDASYWTGEYDRQQVSMLNEQSQVYAELERDRRISEMVLPGALSAYQQGYGVGGMGRKWDGVRTIGDGRREEEERRKRGGWRESYSEEWREDELPGVSMMTRGYAVTPMVPVSGLVASGGEMGMGEIEEKREEEDEGGDYEKEEFEVDGDEKEREEEMKRKEEEERERKAREEEENEKKAEEMRQQAEIEQQAKEAEEQKQKEEEKLRKEEEERLRKEEEERLRKETEEKQKQVEAAKKGKEKKEAKKPTKSEKGKLTSGFEFAFADMPKNKK